MPKDDAIIQEVRAARHRIAESCGYDIAKIIAHANETAERLGFVNAEG